MTFHWNSAYNDNTDFFGKIIFVCSRDSFQFILSSHEGRGAKVIRTYVGIRLSGQNGLKQTDKNGRKMSKFEDLLSFDKVKYLLSK